MKDRRDDAERKGSNTVYRMEDRWERKIKDSLRVRKHASPSQWSTGNTRFELKENTWVKGRHLGARNTEQAQESTCGADVVYSTVIR